MTEPTWTPGVFVWRELMTPDIAKAKAFYAELLGWTYEESDMGDFVYTMAKVGETPIAGIMDMKGSEHPPHWMSYVSVADVDAASEAATANGGTVAVGPMDIPSVGRFAVIGDPDGAYVSLFRSAMGDPTEVEMPPKPGTFCWETLSANDVVRSGKFYQSVVGWSFGPSPMGPDVPVFKAGETPVADVQKAQNMPPNWATYVVVPSLAEAHAIITKGGGAILVERIPVPGVGDIAFFTDPTGAALGLLEPPAQ